MLVSTMSVELKRETNDDRTVIYQNPHDSWRRVAVLRTVC
jgi:hypothetical protein